MKLQQEKTEEEYSIFLVDRILLGSQSAETDMVKRYQSKLFRIVFAKSKDTDLTREIVQETWAITLQKIRNAKLLNKGSLGGYIYKTGINQLKMHYRSRNKVSFVDNIDFQETGDGQALSSSYTDYGPLFESVYKPLSQMKVGRDRQLIYHFYFEGVSKSELCEKFELSSEHFDRVLYRARERFKKAWHISNDSL